MPRKRRFTKYGDTTDGSLRHVTDFENEDLTAGELRLKLNAAIEDNDETMAIEIQREIKRRRNPKTLSELKAVIDRSGF